MIGTALSKADMKVLVDHMADIDKPWVGTFAYFIYEKFI